MTMQLPPDLPPEVAEALRSEGADMMMASMFTRGIQLGEEYGLFVTQGEGDDAQMMLTPDGLAVGAVIHGLLEQHALKTSALVVPGRDGG